MVLWVPVRLRGLSFTGASDMAHHRRSTKATAEGFVGGLEVTVFAAVMVSVILGVLELFGVLLAREELARLAEFSVAQLADQVVTDATVRSDLAQANYTVTVTKSDESCPTLHVSLAGSHTGVVTRRTYVLVSEASQIVTAYRDFSGLNGGEDQC